MNVHDFIEYRMEKTASKRHVLMDKLNPFSKGRRLRESALETEEGFRRTQEDLDRVLKTPGASSGNISDKKHLRDHYKNQRDIHAGRLVEHKVNLKNVKPGTTRQRVMNKLRAKGRK